MADLADALDAFLSGDDDAFEPPDDVATIDDKLAADRLLRRKGRLERKLAEVDELVDARIAELQEWRTQQQASTLRTLEWVNRSLEAWTRAMNRDNPKLKTVTLTAGVTRLRPTQPRLVVDDQAELLAFIEARQLVEVEYEPKFSTADVKKKLKVGARTGEAPTADGFVPHCAVYTVPPDPDAPVLDGTTDDVTGIVVPGVTFLVREELNFTSTANRPSVAAVADPGDNDSNTEPQGDNDG